MQHAILVVTIGLFLLSGVCSHAQTKLKLSAIKPGTERVQYISNGDFQFQGTQVSGNYPTPDGWSRNGDIFATAGSNTVPVNLNVVAKAQVNGGAPVSGYSRLVALEPATQYILSAYLWNMGNAANRVNTVIDLNDAPGEPQIVLTYTDADADKGYFVHQSFNTSTTGTNIVLRAFYDGLTGTGAAPAYFPVAAQWDNIAITKAAQFIAPQASNSTGTLRPLVTITNPANGALLYLPSGDSAINVAASASDLDGVVTNVTFFAGANKIGERASAPWTVSWSNAPSGNHTLTAIAQDNNGADTISAPVPVSVASALAGGAPPRLSITGTQTNVLLSWSATNVPMLLQATSNLIAPIAWQDATNAVFNTNDLNVASVSAGGSHQFFRLKSQVDPGTMHNKLLMGYQGWFACPGDGSPPNRWVHWFRNNNPVVTNLNFDMWPDVSEFDADELFATSLTFSNGATARLFSSYHPKTVMRHFRWMRDHQLDGVFLQRFSSELSDAAFFALRNQVTLNVRAGAETHGRAFAIMYDISGTPTNNLVSVLTNDWNFLTTVLQLTNSPFYLRHDGRPVVAVWGFGFSGRQDTPQQAAQVIAHFKSSGLTVMGGVPTYWRTLNNDAQSNPGWSNVFRSFDIISPWSVGRYADNAGADNFRANLIVPDLAAATAAGRDYMPVIWPGFSWTNLNKGPLNQIPRNGGNFYWRQAFNAVQSGCTMIYGAMFDEVDEGTAMFKTAATPADQPAQGAFVPLNADGVNVPNDWYLKLANEAGKMLRGEIPLQSTIPISP
ncbi:MAG TPA: Ig-like domain-containing protein [Verrucomicrobiota bacterium]|nr:Ig-like domain-containing protein [Verrucomicrobiota bacterium]